MTEGRDVWWHEVATDDTPCPPEPMDAEDLLYLLYTSGTTAKPKGIAHTTAGYLVGVATTHHYIFDLKPETDVYWCAADVGWVTGHSYIVYGPLCNGATSVMYEGTPDFPDKDRWWEIVERYGVTILYTAPTAIRAHMKWGPRVRAAARPLEPAPARLGRRADQPRGVDLVPREHRRRPLPDRRHVVADRDRDDPDHAAPGRHDDEARLGRRGRSRASTPRSTTRPATTSGRRRRLPRAAPAVARDAARDLRRRRALPRHVLVEVPGHVLRRRRRADRRRRRLLAARPGRRRDERLRPPHLDDRGRERARRPPRRRRGRGRRAQRRADRPGDRRVRDAEERRRGHGRGARGAAQPRRA